MITYTYALLEISPAAYEEIKTKLEAAGYADQFHEQDGKIVIDMRGIALVTAPEAALSTRFLRVLATCNHPAECQDHDVRTMCTTCGARHSADHHRWILTELGELAKALID